MKIVTVVGARPQFVKAASISRAIANENAHSKGKSPIDEVIVHTGQHYDQNMSDIFFEEMQIPKPKYRMDITGRTHGAMTAEIITNVEDVLKKENPELLLVYGDTNTTLAAALASCKLHIPVAHVEAGLRSHNMCMPEEINRILTDKVSSILFCPTQKAVSNLKKEGFQDFLNGQTCQEKLTFRYGFSPLIVNSGDVMYDSALFYANISMNLSKVMQTLPFSHHDFALSTIHRAENTENPERLRNLVKGLKKVAQLMPVVIPLHPRTKKYLDYHHLSISDTGIKVIEPVGYLDMIQLIRNCKLVLTDSGGLQKEAYFFRKPCVTLRDETEWIELVESGYNLLSGCNPDKVFICAEKQLQKTFTDNGQLYGGGNASTRIVRFLKQLEFV